MKGYRVLAVGLLLVTMVAVSLAGPAIAQGPEVPEGRVEGPLPAPDRLQKVSPPELSVSWQYGPPSAFEYQRFDAIFVPGPAGEAWANKVYFLGGRISAPAENPNIWVFDPVTGVYTDTLADMIEDVSNYNSNLVLDDGTGRGPAVYVVGGYDKDGGSGGGNLGLVQRYYPQGNVIESLPPEDNWPGKVNGLTVGGMGSGVVDDVIYVFGGWQSTSSPYFYAGTWALDPGQPSGSRWTNLGVSLSPGRSYIMTAVQDNKIYALGGISGYTGADLVPTNAVEVLDTSNVAAGWSTVAPLPVAIAEGRAFGFDDDTRAASDGAAADAPWSGLLFTAGGGDWPDISREAMVYDIGSDTWDQGFPDLNDRRVNNAGAFVPLCTPDPNDGLPGLWVFGGRSENDCDPPYGATEFYPLPCADCVMLAGATITGTAEVLVGERVTYTVSLEPGSATPPIDVLWSNGMTGTEAVYSWTEPGMHDVSVTCHNCGGFAEAVDSLAVDVICIGLDSAAIEAPAELAVGETGLFTVTLLPPAATQPIDILWSNGSLSATTAYSWTVPGTQTVVVTATNCSGVPVTDSVEVTVPEPWQRIYLPVVVRNH